MRPVGAMLLGVAVFSLPRRTYLQSKYNKRSHPLAPCALISCSAVDALHTRLKSTVSRLDAISFFISDSFFFFLLKVTHASHFNYHLFPTEFPSCASVTTLSLPIRPQTKAGACALFCQTVVVIGLIYLFFQS